MIRHTLLAWLARLLLIDPADVVDWDGVDLQERVDDDDRLAAALDWDAVDVYEFVDEHEHLAGPTEILHDLDDDPDRIYIWEVETPEAERQLHRQIVDEYRREFDREPRAAHFVVADLERLREFDPDELAAYVAPRQVGGEA
jgi:hypothetical protein